MPGTKMAVERVEAIVADGPYSGDGLVNALVDLVADIKLYCVATGWVGWDYVDQLSDTHYEAELDEEADGYFYDDDGMIHHEDGDGNGDQS